MVPSRRVLPSMDVNGCIAVFLDVMDGAMSMLAEEGAHRSQQRPLKGAGVVRHRLALRPTERETSAPSFANTARATLDVGLARIVRIASRMVAFTGPPPPRFTARAAGA